MYIGFIILFVCCLVILHRYILGDYSVEKGTEEAETLTPNQRRLYDVLSFHGYQIKANYPCGNFVLDLALPGQRIAIECKNKVIDLSTRKYNINGRKEKYLKNKGWILLLFTGAEIRGNSENVIGRIEDAIIRAQAD